MKPVLAALALCLGVSSVAASDLADIEAATLMLYQNGNSVCSSQIVHSAAGETILLTAFHCTDGPKDAEFSVRLTTRDEKRRVVSYTVYNADVIRKNQNYDLAVLRLRDDKITLPTIDIATAEEADTLLFKGAGVLAAGYPATRSSGHEDLVFSDGLFTGVRDSFVPIVEIDVYRATVPVWYGKSGGGLYTQIGGEWKLVGVATQLDPETPWETSLWIPAKRIHEMLKGAWVVADKAIDLSDPGYFEK